MEQIQIEYWEMDIWKVNEFNFLNEEVEELLEFTFSFWHGDRIWINFSIVIHEKIECLMQLGSEGAKVSLTAAGPGQSHTRRPGKVDFNCSEGHRLADYLFIFYVKFSANWKIFV